jgi:hypothetical protein
MNGPDFLTGTKKLFRYYKDLAEKALAQLDDAQINWKPNEASNSIAIIVHHLSGNMLSRFTDFLTTDGEKPWRHREAEFEIGYKDKSEMMDAWHRGWNVFFNAIEPLTEQDLDKIIYIRNEGQSVMDSLQRQLAHYPSHIGQIIYIAKMQRGDAFKSLSIPKGASSDYNQKKFSEEKSNHHFTDRV